MATTQPVYIYGLLESQAEEGKYHALHASRLLNVEERPLQRVTKHFLPRAAPLRNPSPSTDTTRLRAEILLDFASLSNSLLRIQILSASNARERARYAHSKAAILATAQDVRDDTVSLRAQLVEAQKVLERRKGYDRLAATVLEDRKLKGREEAKAEIERLEREMEGLRVEGREAEGAWVGRREAFDRVLREGELLRKVMRGEKEEDGDGEGEGEGEGEKEDEEDAEAEAEGEESMVGTPRAGGRTPVPASIGEGGETPLPGSTGEAGDATPARNPLTNRFLDVDDTATRGPFSGAASPLRHEVETPKAEDDIEMEAETGDSVPIAGEEAAADTMDET